MNMSDTTYVTGSLGPTTGASDRSVVASPVTALPDSRRSGPRKPEPVGLTGETSSSASPMRPLSRLGDGAQRPDPVLLQRAADLLDDIESLDPESLALTIESLRNVVCKLWFTAASATVYHHSILANVESFLLSHDSVDSGQAAALRGAIKDLSLRSIGEQHASVVRSQFVDQGQKSLAILGDVELGQDD